MDSRAEIFLDKYKQLENAITLEYGPFNGRYESAIGYILNNNSFRKIRAELDICRETRNLLAHNPRINGDYAVEPSQKMIDLLDYVIDKVSNPLRAKDIMINKNKLYCKTMDDGVREAMIAMHKNGYTHVPIEDNGVVAGVFSDNTLLSYLIDEELVSIENDLKFSHIQKYLPLENHSSESFRFVGQNTLVSDIVEMFDRALANSDRIGMVFVTHSGKKSEKILGIITAWDVIAEIEMLV